MAAGAWPRDFTKAFKAVGSTSPMSSLGIADGMSKRTCWFEKSRREFSNGAAHCPRRHLHTRLYATATADRILVMAY